MIVHVHATYFHFFFFYVNGNTQNGWGVLLLNGTQYARPKMAVCSMQGGKRCHPHTLQNIFNLIRHFNQEDQGARVFCTSCNQCTSLYIINVYFIICFVDITSCLITMLHASLLHISASATYILNVYTACHNVHTLSTKIFT